MTPTIFCPTCGDLVLDQPVCAACGWRRPSAAQDAGGLAWQGELGGRLRKPRCYPAIAAGRYCAPTEDGAVVALDLATGQKVWSRLLGEGCAAHALATDGRRCFVGCADTRPIPAPGKALLALDMRTGEPAWEYPTGAHSLSAAAVAGEAVYFTSSDGLLHAVDGPSGRRRWARAHPCWGPEAPAIGAEVICAGGRGETLIAYALADGAERWRFAGGGWFAGELCIADGHVYALCWDGWLYVLDAPSGRLLWKTRAERDKGFTAPPVAAGGRVFIGGRVYRVAGEQQSAAYAMLALQAADGAELWRFYTDRHIFVPPAVSGDTLLFGSDDGCFYALDAVCGAERWRTRIDGRIVAQPQVVGDLAFVAERDGMVAAIRWRPTVTEGLLPPETYLERGEYELAAITSALGGQCEAAAVLYEQRLGRPREAALLYERAGKPGMAAPLWQRLGELRRARDCYSVAGDAPGLAAVLAQLGEPLQAARVYEESGQAATAAELYEQSGDRVRAAELYDQAGQYSRAHVIWESLGQWERLVGDLIREGKPAEAAAILERERQLERAAELYEGADQLQQALRVRVALEHWERVAALASRVGDYEQAAAAHERLCAPLPAAIAYARAAERASATAPVDEERVAALYERAALLYDDLYEEERAGACRGHIRRYRHLPELVVVGEAHEAFVEYEWNTFTLRVQNTGYGPAHDIAVLPHGEFDVEGDDHIAALPAGRSAALELSLRPHHEQYGPKVPLEIVVQFEDARQGRYEIVQQCPVHVMRQGAEPGIVTPLEIRVGPPPAALGQEEIDQQLTLLKTHRRRLAVLLEQHAHLGTAYAPPSIALDIGEARAEIRRLKAILRRAGAMVEDSPNDEP